MIDAPVALLVFSLASSLQRVVDVLRGLNIGKVVLLSTCNLFEMEREQLDQATDKDLIFHNFSDFISYEEMMRCDMDADRIIYKRHGERRFDLLLEYYNEIRSLKNSIILDNVRKMYSVSEVLVLDGELGICRETWGNKGRDDVSTGSNVSRPSILARLKSKKSSILEYEGESYLFLGDNRQVRQFLSDQVAICGHSRCISISIHVLLYAINRVTCSKIPLSGLLASPAKCVFRVLFLSRIKGIVTTIHEYGMAAAVAAPVFGLDLICLQDGFLPANYTSSYIKYFGGVDFYYVFDCISRAFFKKFGLPSQRSGMFIDPALPLLPEVPLAVRRVLVVASGSGEWTAFKNRSDEDMMFEAFVEVARRMPSIEFVYRPHPLWVHPAHQGCRSIQRLFEICKNLGLRNLFISQNEGNDSDMYCRDLRQYLRFASIDDEIDQCDFVFGDHSQVMINACRMGKVFASVNFTARMSFFDSFNVLGFHHCRTVEEIVGLLDAVSESVGPVEVHNVAVERYNAENRNQE